MDRFNFWNYFAGLPDKQLYPSVSAVYGNTEVRSFRTTYVDLCNLDLFQVSMVYLGPPLDGWKCRHYVVSCCCISTAHTFNRLLIFCYVALSWSSLWRPEMYLTASTRANRLLTGLSDLLLWGGCSCASELLLAPPLVISGGVFTHAQTLQTWVKLLSNEIFQVSSIYVLC